MYQNNKFMYHKNKKFANFQKLIHNRKKVS